MGSLLRSVKKRKKSRRLGEVEMVRHEDYGELALDAKVEMIRSLVPLGCLRCLLLVMCTHPFAKEALTLHLPRSEGHERYLAVI